MINKAGRNEQAIESALKSEIQRTRSGLSQEQQSAAAKAGVPHFRVGNYEEAAQRGVEDTLFPSLFPKR